MQRTAAGIGCHPVPDSREDRIPQRVEGHGSTHLPKTSPRPHERATGKRRNAICRASARCPSLAASRDGSWRLRPVHRVAVNNGRRRICEGWALAIVNRLTRCGRGQRDGIAVEARPLGESRRHLGGSDGLADHRLLIAGGAPGRRETEVGVCLGIGWGRVSSGAPAGSAPRTSPGRGRCLAGSLVRRPMPWA